MSRPARQPLRLRLTVLVVGLCVLVLAVTGSATLVVLIGSLHQRVDAQLATTVSGLRALATIEHDLPGRLIPPERTSFGSLYLAVLEPGRTPRGPGPALALPLPVPGELVTVPGTGPGAARSYRVMTTLLAGGHVGVIGLSLDETEDAVHAMVAVVVIVEVLGVAILGLLSAWIVRRELRPLESSARTADLIAAGDLTHRLSRSGEPPLSTRTEVGRLAAALDRMLDQIQAAFEARDTSEGRLRQFVADASHELRTPLQSIRAYAELYLSDALPDAAAEREAVERMHAEARRMARLVQSLLQLARFDQEHETDFQAFDLTSVVLDCCRDSAAVEPGRPLTWDIHERITLVGDEEQLSQLVGNLLGNVRMHTPPGVSCHLDLALEGDEVVLRVTDQGPGIPDEALPLVFDRFYRADKSRSRASGGSGLGLAIVAAIADAHRGRVHIDSPDGQGTRIEVRLPHCMR